MSDVRKFTAIGGRTLFETFLNDLRMLTDVRCDDDPEDRYLKGRRTAVVIMYASGEIGVTEGWSLNGGDFRNDRLLEAGAMMKQENTEK